MWRPARIVRDQLRVVLPHTYYLSGLLLLYLLTDVALVLVNVPLRWGWLPEGNRIAGQGMLYAAAAYGSYRAIHFHPFLRPDYGKWLRHSPWTSKLPLPNGPVYLVWQDAILLALATTLSMRSDQIHPLAAAAAFLACYLVVTALTLKLTSEGTYAFLVLMTIGGGVRAHERPIVAMTCLVVSYGFAAWGLRRSFRRFREWDLDYWEDRRSSDLVNDGEPGSKARDQQVGWPFGQLSPKSRRRPKSAPYGLAVAALCGWGTHVGLHYALGGVAILADSKPLYLLVVGTFSGILAFLRLGIYCSGYGSPISLWGRLATFRWIIPSYDQVFATPLFMVVAGLFGSSIFASLNVPFVYGAPLLLAVMVALAFTMPPSLDDWRLIGGHRVSPQVQNNKAEFVQTQ